MKHGFVSGSIVSAVVVISTVFALYAGSVAADTTDETETMDEDGEIVSLKTATPEEGFALALALSRKGVTETQPDSDVLHELRPEYSQDADSLIAASQVAAIHFQTIAAANDYWRD